VKYEVSLCILACNQVKGYVKLTESVRAFDGLDVEIVVGDNSTDETARAFFRKHADAYIRISDRELWYEGFGAVKTKVANAGTRDLVIIGDPDEVWSPIGDNHLRLLRPIVAGTAPPICRTALVENGICVASHGRVFDRRHFRLLGMIHEEAYSKRKRMNWSVASGEIPFAEVKHDQSEHSSEYMRRKGVLYDNLLHRAYLAPDSSWGTRSWWWREYWPSVLEKGEFEPTAFEDWCTDE
jgi:hypothetical protein